MGNAQGSSSGGSSGGKKKCRNKVKAISGIHMSLLRLRSKSASEKRRKSKRSQSYISQDDDHDTNQLPLNGEKELLTPDEIKNIQETWPYLQIHLNSILHEAFLSMFTENPDIKDKFFAFKDYTIEDLRKHDPNKGHTTALQRHVPRVSRALAKVINRADNLSAISDYLKIMGKIHSQNGIQNYEMLVIGPHFVASSVRYIPSALRDKKIQESWLKFFSVIMELMSRGYPPVNHTLSTEEKTFISTTLKSIRKEVDLVGVVTFAQLFQSYAEDAKFTDIVKKSCEKMENETEDEKRMLEEALRNHPVLLVKVAEEACDLMETPTALEAYLFKLGRIHCRFGVRKEHLDVMGPVFCQAIRPVLQAEGQWSTEVKTVWLRFFRMVAHFMKKGYEGQQQEVDIEAPDKALHHLDDESTRNLRRSSSPSRADYVGDRLYVKNQGNSRRISSEDIHKQASGAQNCVKSSRLSPHCHIYKKKAAHNDFLPAVDFDAIEVLEDHQIKLSASALDDLPRKRRGSTCGVLGSHDYLNQPEMILSRTKELRQSSLSTSTGNLLALKIDRFRRSSDHELLTNALFEVTGKPHCYGGKMLKKPEQKKSRSKSIDANAHSKISHA